LKGTPGISHWKVIDRDMNEYATHDYVPAKLKRPLQRSMFPPTKDEAEQFHLDRGFRILPHVQNTGGFFVAVLTKKAHLNPKAMGEQAEASDIVPRAPPAKRRKMQGYTEDPFVFLAKDDERFKDVANYYGINSSFCADNMLARTKEADQKRTLYFVNTAVKEFLQNNQERVKVINAGVKIFGRTETKFNACRFRLAQDGLKIILPYMEKRVVEISPDEMNLIMRGDNGNPNFPREKLECDKILGDLQAGSVVLKATKGTVTKSICAWIGAKSVSPYISKEERIHVVRMLGYDTTALEDEMSSKRKEKALKNRDEHKKSLEASSSIESSQNNTEASQEEGDSSSQDERVNGNVDHNDNLVDV